MNRKPLRQRERQRSGVDVEGPFTPEAIVSTYAKNAGSDLKEGVKPNGSGKAGKMVTEWTFRGKKE